MCFRKKKDNSVTDPYTSRADTDERDYIQLRLLPQIEYYSKSSRRMRRKYYIFSIANTAFMAAVPVILLLPDTIKGAKYISASVSAIASVLSSILLILRAKDNWIEYRNASEALKSEFATFKARAADYRELRPHQQLSLFVERCEGIMQSERSGWYSRMKLDSNLFFRRNNNRSQAGPLRAAKRWKRFLQVPFPPLILNEMRGKVKWTSEN